MRRILKAHIVRNQSSKGFRAVKALEATHRWCLTGTPIQNRVEDFGALMDFLHVSPFDDGSIFKQEISFPIKKEDDMGFQRLACLVRATSMRRVKTDVNDDFQLQDRHETLERVKLDPGEQQIYDIIRKAASNAVDVEDASAGSCENCSGPMEQDSAPENSILQCYHQICVDCLRPLMTNVPGKNVPCPVCHALERLRAEEATKPPKMSICQDTYSPSSKVKALLKNLTSDGHGQKVASSLAHKRFVE